MDCYDFSDFSMKITLLPEVVQKVPSQKQPPQVVFKKGVFTKFTRKHLRNSLFFNKGRGLRSVTLFKMETLAQMFSCECGKIFEKKAHLQWLLLNKSFYFRFKP